MIYRVPYLALLYLLMAGCMATKLQPDWVQQHPVHEGYYIGIASVGKVPGSSDHITRARTLALKEIASEIALSISSHTSMTEHDSSGHYTYDFLSGVQATVRADLEGYELTDTWEDQERFWVYYRLPKVRWEEVQRHKLEQRAGRVVELFGNANVSESRGDFVASLKQLVQAATEAGHYSVVALPGVSLHGLHVMNEVQPKLLHVLSVIRIEASPAVLQSEFLEEPHETCTIRVTATTRNGETVPVFGFPIMLTEASTGMTRGVTATTDRNGTATCSLPSSDRIGRFQFVFSTDAEALTGRSIGDLEEGIPYKIQFPQTTLSVEVRPVSVFLTSEEKHVGIAESRSIMIPPAAEILSASGFTITPVVQAARFRIVVQASAVEGMNRQGIYTAFASGKLTVISYPSDETRVEVTGSRISGAGTSYEEAGRQAMEKLARHLMVKFLESVSRPQVPEHPAGNP